MKKGYIKPECVLHHLMLQPLMDQSIGNDPVTNDPSQGNDNNEDGFWTPEDTESKENIWGWEDDSWEEE